MKMDLCGIVARDMSDWFFLHIFRLRMGALYLMLLSRMSHIILKLKISSSRSLTYHLKSRKPIFLFRYQKLSCPQTYLFRFRKLHCRQVPVYLMQLMNQIPPPGLISVGTQEIEGGENLARMHISWAGNRKASWIRSDIILLLLWYLVYAAYYAVHALTHANMISTVHAAHLGTHTRYSGGNINICLMLLINWFWAFLLNYGVLY